MAGLTIDIGHAYVAYRELQASTDAAALAAGTAMASSTATLTTVRAAATSYSSATGGANVDSNMLPGVTITTTPVCLTRVSWVNCGATVLGNYNAVQVSQTMTAPTFFMRALNAFGIHTTGTIPLTTVASASMLGSANTQYNVALVIDTTASMKDNDTDGNCNGSQLECAEQGAQTLLNLLTPCGGTSTATNCASAFDTVALFTFPNVSNNTIAGDYTCTATAPNIVAYSVPSKTATTYTPSGTLPTYEVSFGAGTPPSTTGFLDDYSSNNAFNGGLKTTSPLGIALGQDPNGTKKVPCNGLQAPGGEGTYLAGAVYAAKAALLAAQTANPGSQNAMIILTDGDAPGSWGSQDAFIDATTGKAATLNDTGSTVGNYPSSYDQCEQAVVAAQSATAAGITVYTIAYKSPISGGCVSDVHAASINKLSGANPNGTGVQPCTALRNMATNLGDFYSDSTTTDGGGCLSSVNPNLTLTGVFTSVATKFTRARLVPSS
jgi:hypothetical protein